MALRKAKSTRATWTLLCTSALTGNPHCTAMDAQICTGSSHASLLGRRAVTSLSRSMGATARARRRTWAR